LFIIVIPNLNLFKLKFFLKKMSKGLAAAIVEEERVTKGKKDVFSKKFRSRLDAVRAENGRILYGNKITEIMAESFGSDIIPDEIVEFAHRTLLRKGYSLKRNGVDYENLSFGWTDKTQYIRDKQIFSF
jgi:hypothetical protein